MRRAVPFRVILCSMFIALLLTGCLTDSGGDGDESDNTNPLFTKKTMTITSTTTKLIENEHVNFQVKSTPKPEASEWLIYRFTGPDTTRYVLQDAGSENDLWQESFEAGDWSVFVAIYDSTEFKALDELAPDHGSASLAFTVRRITVDLTADTDESPQDIVFHAVSPEKAWIHSNADYVWTFGDGDMKTTTGIDSVLHHYELPGEYQATVTIKCAIREDAYFKDTVAADTLDITVEPDTSTSLELTISPQDTVWNTTSGLSLAAEPSLDRYEYPDRVKWVIDYGDGESDENEAYLFDRGIHHRYYDPGTYILSVSIYDPETDQLLAEDTATITISNLPFLKETNYVKFSVNGFTNRRSGELVDDTFIESSDWENLWGFYWNTSDLSWDGRDASSEYEYTSGTQTTEKHIDLTLSSDGSTVLRLEYTHEFIDTDYHGNGTVWARYEHLVIENVPLTANSTYFHRFYQESTEVGQYVTEFEAWEKYEHTDDTVGYTFYDDFDWQNTSKGTPNLTVEFKQW